MLLCRSEAPGYVLVAEILQASSLSHCGVPGEKQGGLKVVSFSPPRLFLCDKKLRVEDSGVTLVEQGDNNGEGIESMVFARPSPGIPCRTVNGRGSCNMMDRIGETEQYDPCFALCMLI